MDSFFLQRRYLVSFESRKLPHIFTDVLIIGGGAAGLRAAIEAARYGQVIMMTKNRLPDSNTYHAQGGLAAVFAEDDSLESHIEDTLITGAGMCDEDVVRRVVTDAPKHIMELQQWGVAFDRVEGRLDLGREGGHRANRIIHADGDATGRAMANVLIEHARKTENLKIFEECFTIDLLTDPAEGGPDSQCVGALTYHPRYGLQIIIARRTILAAGGAGMLWRETSNPNGATADAIGMAFRAGVVLGDLEMMQFHPTTLYVAGATRSLISEAVRGEGGYLVDRHGDRFMGDYHEMGELAPRDVVSRAILSQMVKTNSTHVFLDVRHFRQSQFASRFPQIYELCRSFEIDPANELIPVHPAAHYMIGGARVDMDGQTSLPGLLACGEAACTGLHGANRLASNSLTEALVFGRRCGEMAGQAMESENDKPAARPINWSMPQSQRSELDLTDIRNSLRSVMWRNVGIARRGDRLTDTLDIVRFWDRYVLDKEFFDPAGWEIQNMLTAARLIAESAMRRTETRGVHYREDFPDIDPQWARHQYFRKAGRQLVIE